ncbi:MAG: radical SAM protein [Theionarchaea archaeon]|nr:radical SAM protein [Theionarchaea archaeon]MBU7000610.1 radical SAM protein [Theionarchaea archaeon]MBU7035960.1 radical SAM protein [Theionarchaea archaeon]MBU7041779.1 radical SAM protein [Theionarchaea archaeon]
MRALKKRITVELPSEKYLLINPYSGLADIIDSETKNLLDSESSDATYEVLRILKSRGHLVEEGEEDDLFEYLKLYAQELHSEACKKNHHLIIPTYHCNLTCPYCFQKHVYRKRANLHMVMDEQTVDSLFKAILFLDSETEEKCIELYGGEPLQVRNISIIEYILRKGDYNGYSFRAITNGADFYHFVPLLSEFDVKEVQITLDGPRNVHDQRRFRKGGTFDDIVKGIDLALEHDIPIRIRINVDYENIDSIPELAQFYIEKGWSSKVKASITSVYASECVEYPSVIPLEDVPRKIIDLFFKDERMTVFSDTFKGLNFLLGHLLLGEEFHHRFWACNAHTTLLFYDPLGDIYACGEAVGHPEHVIGKYIPALRFNDTYSHWRNRTVFAIPECTECNLAFFCGGGCAYKAYTETHSIYSPYCENVKFSLNCEVPYLYHVAKQKEEKEGDL